MLSQFPMKFATLYKHKFDKFMKLKKHLIAIKFFFVIAFIIVKNLTELEK